MTLILFVNIINASSNDDVAEKEMPPKKSSDESSTGFDLVPLNSYVCAGNLLSEDNRHKVARGKEGHNGSFTRWYNECIGSCIQWAIGQNSHGHWQRDEHRSLRIVYMRVCENLPKNESEMKTNNGDALAHTRTQHEEMPKWL